MLKELIKRTPLYGIYDIIQGAIWGGYYRIAPVKHIISREFEITFNRKLDWKNPKDLNEKINWLKLYSDTKLWTELSDKYKVRDYIKAKGLCDILVPIYGCWQNAYEIDFDSLPSSFVLKTNHGSGDIIVVRDKSEIDRKSIIKELNKALKTPFGYRHGEPHYLYIKPCIIAEKYLEQPSDSYTSSIVDYKIWCFSGKPAYIWACYSRSKEAVYVEVHDLDWTYQKEKSVFTSHYRDGGGVIPKPKNLDKMLEVATILSEGFPQVRVDLYNCDGKIFFGEMTFTSNGGFNNFYTKEFLEELGSKINITK